MSEAAALAPAVGLAHSQARLVELVLPNLAGVPLHSQIAEAASVRRRLAAPQVLVAMCHAASVPR